MADFWTVVVETRTEILCTVVLFLNSLITLANTEKGRRTVESVVNFAGIGGSVSIGGDVAGRDKITTDANTEGKES